MLGTPDSNQDRYARSPRPRGRNVYSYKLGSWDRNLSAAYLDVHFDDDWRVVDAQISRVGY